MTTDYNHLDALYARLYRARRRLAAAKTRHARDFFARQVIADEKEVAGEFKRLGIPPAPEMTVDEIASELQGD